MWFDGWNDLLRILVVGTSGYAALVLILRVTGTRTLSKLNAFDFVVTIALGSTLSALLLDSSVSWSEGVFALALLIGLQYGVTWLQVRSRLVNQLVKGEPTLLVHNGVLLERAMARARISEDEIRAALREHGITRITSAAAVVLESDGSLTAISSP